MTEDIDVEALLEAPYRKDAADEHANVNRSSDDSRKERDRHKERRRSRSRSRSRDRHRRSSDRHSRDWDRRGGDRDRDRYRRSERDYSRERGSDRFRSSPPSRYNGGGGGGYRGGGDSRDRGRMDVYQRRGNFEMSLEERDARTVFVWQLSAKIRSLDLEDFFSSVGSITDVRLIMDNKTRRSKGIAYVEFRDAESVQLALALTGTKLLGVPIQVQRSQAEKNRVGQPPSVLASLGPAAKTGPLKLYVGSLHPKITESMLRGIFEPFGKIDALTIVTDIATGKSLGYGFVTYHSAEDAKKALEQLNGFELANQPMKVGHVVDKSGDADAALSGMPNLDNDEIDKTGFDLGTTGRLALMAKLAEGTGMVIPAATKNALLAHSNQQALAHGASLSALSAPAAAAVVSNWSTHSASNTVGVPPVATQCFMLTNMFDLKSVEGSWADEIRDDVLDECNKFVGLLHIYVDKDSVQGNVYVKCPSIASAAQCVNSLHGRWFSGRVITAAYVPLPNYHQLFPESSKTTTLIGAQTNVASYGW